VKASKCPVCNGEGKLLAGNTTANAQEVPCHRCLGKGWVEVSE